MKTRGLFSAILLALFMSVTTVNAQQTAAQTVAGTNSYAMVDESIFTKELEGRTAATSHPLLSAITTCGETRGFTGLMLVIWGKTASNFPDISKFNDCLVEVTPLDASGQLVGKVLFARLAIGAPSKRSLQFPHADPMPASIKGARIRLLPPGDKTIVTWTTTYKPQ